MFKFAITSLVVAFAITGASALPIDHGTDIAPSVKVCTGNVGTGCVTIPVVSDTCVNFTGGLTFLSGEVSSAVIPGGFVCTFVENFGCDSVKGGAVVLQGGTWNFASVPGTTGNINFNDDANSFTCSPV